jgi:hypothetical protein
MTGKLHKKDDNTWVVISTESTKEMPTHPEHKLWIKMFGKDGLDVCFKVETIADGTSEFDIMDVDVAKLTSCSPDIRTYTQD